MGRGDSSLKEEDRIPGEPHTARSGLRGVESVLRVVMLAESTGYTADTLK